MLLGCEEESEVLVQCVGVGVGHFAGSRVGDTARGQVPGVPVAIGLMSWTKPG